MESSLSAQQAQAGARTVYDVWSRLLLVAGNSWENPNRRLSSLLDSLLGFARFQDSGKIVMRHDITPHISPVGGAQGDREIRYYALRYGLPVAHCQRCPRKRFTDAAQLKGHKNGAHRRRPSSAVTRQGVEFFSLSFPP